MTFRPQFRLWHLLVLTTAVCVMSAFPIIAVPVLVLSAIFMISAGAVLFLSRRQLIILLWTAAACVIAFAIVIGLHVIWLNERSDFLHGNPEAAGSSSNYDYESAPGLLRFFHACGFKTISVSFPTFKADSKLYRSEPPFRIAYARKLFPEAVIVVVDGGMACYSWPPNQKWQP